MAAHFVWQQRCSHEQSLHAAQLSTIAAPATEHVTETRSPPGKQGCGTAEHWHMIAGHLASYCDATTEKSLQRSLPVAHDR
jgi:hypothetical protein